MPSYRYPLLAVAALALAACGPRHRRPIAPARAPIAVIPAPLSMHVDDAAFALDSTVTITVDAPSDTAMQVAEALARQMRFPTGFPLPVSQASGATPRLGIRLRHEPSRADLGDEGYALLVNADSVVLVARTPAGLFHGIQTIRQLLPFGIEGENAVIRYGVWRIPAVTITDRPRFAWRGAMLDVSRHFFTVDEVKQYVDLLALYKLNVLHLHLGDDQGFRMEIKSRPALAGVPAATQVGGGLGGFYTQAEYSDIVKYAADRFVTIVPEIDMPAHSNAMSVAYPEVSCGRQPPVPYFSIHVGFSALCPDSAATWALVDDVVREIAALTPGPFFHIGGDEVEVLTHEQYVQFVDRAQQIVNKYGKRMIGWEEIYRANLAPGTLVQQWRSDSARNALAQGVKLILSPGPKLYLDMKYTDSTELGLKWAGTIPVQTVYDWDPATYIQGVTENDLVGIEAPLWTETIRNVTAAFYMVMPRLPAVAEVGWTSQAQRNYADFRGRLSAHAPRWRLLGINFYPEW